MEQLSPYVRDQIVAGNAVLFLGAGASQSATGKGGNHGLSGSQLRDKLSEKFLGGEGKTRPLSHVADRCMNAAGMGAVHQYLRELFGDLQPTHGHKLIPSFRWRGIVTTNYDLLVERAYEQDAAARQVLERIIWDRDNFDAATRNPDAVAYLKLHGCLNRLNDPELPLVLSSHDYYKFKANRGQLVNTLREWGTTCPIIFCGYSIADENVKEILFDLTDKYLARPTFVLVDPSLESGDISYWKSLRFDCLPLRFDEFMNQLHRTVSKAEVTLGSVRSADETSVSKLIPSHARPSLSLSRYLESELTHVHSSLSTPLVPPRDFYRGNSDGFAWISEKFDVRRRVVDTLLEDAFLDSSRSNFEKPYLYILKGYAGSGKSVALKRLAWEAATDYSAAVFHLGEGSVLRVPEILELARLIGSRIHVILDDALVHSAELKEALKESKRLRLRLTFIGGARTNEWNVSSDGIGSDADAEYELLDLNKNEVDGLIQKLAANGCLGYLEHLDAKQRLDYFLEKLKSQLLVALHEATEGKSFEEIIADEYQRVSPTEARLLYLDVCTLDRFDVGVRAGLLARLSGITFEQFSKSLLRPLEHVIHVTFSHRVGDYLFRSRHHHIAALVFDHALQTPSERASQIVRLLRFLNGAYESDRRALQQIVRGRILAEHFSEKSYAGQIFDSAIESGMHPSVVDHQRAVFELHHPGGDLRAALALISRVEQNLGPLQGRTVAHTKSNILRRLASGGKTGLERDRYRQDALAILNNLTKSPRDALPFLTRGQLLLEQLQERMQQAPTATEEDEVDSRVVAELTKEIESNLRQGLQLFPEDEKLLTFEAELSRFLNNSPRALRALERAYSANKESVYTTIRLARQYSQSPETLEKSLAMLRKLAAEQPLSKEAHYELARVLISRGESANSTEISQHLRRSFSSGDSHLEARFTYARHEFLYGSVEKARTEFASLSRAGGNPEQINQVRGEVRDKAGGLVWYDGTITSVHDSFSFVRTTSFQESIFMHFTALPNQQDWEGLRAGARIRLTLGFSYKGPKVKKATLVK